MGAVTYPDPKVAGELESWIRRSVDVDDEAGKPIARAFGIKFLPTAVALDGDGRVLARVQGFQSPGKFAQTLADARGQS